MNGGEFTALDTKATHTQTTHSKLVPCYESETLSKKKSSTLVDTLLPSDSTK